MFPQLNRAILRYAPNLIVYFLQHYKIELPEDLHQIGRRGKPKVIIFDDLERTGLSMLELLGFLNVLIEHEGYKLIILADESRIEEKAKYQTFRVNLIGKSFHIEPNFGEAFLTFARAVNSEDCRDFMLNKAVLIERVFNESRTENLRVLQQCVNEFSYLYAKIDEYHRDVRLLMDNVLLLFFSLFFELRTGGLVLDDVSDRINKFVAQSIRHNNDVADTDARILIASKKYSNYLADSVLSDAVLLDLFRSGVVDQAKLNEGFRAAGYGSKPVESFPWYIVWHYRDKSEEDFGTAFRSLCAQAEKRDFHNIHEFLHCFANLLFFAESQVFGREKREVLHWGRRTFRRMIKEQNMSFRDLNNIDFRAAYGYVYLGSDDEEYIRFVQGCRDMVEKEKLKRAPTLSLRLFDLVADDFQRFCSILSLESHDEEFGNLSIHYYSVDTFVDAFLRMDATNQNKVAGAFIRRLERASLLTEKAAEYKWINELAERLEAGGQGCAPIFGFRMKQISQSLRSAIPS